jgi:tripartite-type tricarboxylate transporter receptor subunit TctC
VTKFSARTILGVFAFLIAGPAAVAQSFPTKPVRMILPGPPGGGADVIARPFASKMTELLGQQVLVDNRPGASGVIAGNLTLQAAADGYTMILATASGFSISPHLAKKAPYDVEKDFRGISLVALADLMVAVHPSLPVKSVKELIALAKAKPDSVFYASNGAGSLSHLSTELFAMLAGIKMVHVAYKGGTPAVTDTAAGHVAMVITAVPTLMGLVNAGRLRPLATTGAKRSKMLRHLPTVAEAGLPEYESVQWYGLFAPAGVPDDAVKKLNAAVVQALKAKEVEAIIERSGSEPVSSSGEEMERFVKKDSAKWRKVIGTAKVSIQ